MDEFREEFPEHAKMSPHVGENWAIRDFMKWLAGRGVFLAHYNPLRHKIEGFGEVLPERFLFEWRGVDQAAHEAESELMRRRYGLDKLVARVAEDVMGPPLSHLPSLGLPGEKQLADDDEVSVIRAWEAGLIKAESYTGARMKMSRSRKLYPEIMPKPRYYGSQTLYKVRDLKAWEKEYNRRSHENRVENGRHVKAVRNGPEITKESKTVESGHDPATILMNKLRGVDQ